MKGREADAWHYDVAFDKPDQTRRIMYGGFDGVLDRHSRLLLYQERQPGRPPRRGDPLRRIRH